MNANDSDDSVDDDRHLASDDDDDEKEEEILPSEEEDSDDDDDDSRFERFKIEMKKDTMASDLEDAEDDDDDDENDQDDDDGLPSRQAWGHEKKLFYHTDYVDKDFRGQKPKDEDLARYEEEEAVEIQKRIHSAITDEDLGLELLGLAETPVPAKKIETIPAEYDDLDKEKLHLDPKTMSDGEKYSLIRQESPELELLMADLKQYTEEISKELEPLIQKGLVKMEAPSNNAAAKLLKLRLQCLVNYCANISFYLSMKCSSDRKKVGKEHPIIKRLFTYKKLIAQIDQCMTERLRHEIDAMKMAIECGERLKFGPELLPPPPATENGPGRKKPTEMEFNDAVDDDNVEENEDGKRAITYEMQKNKGLTPKRKREQRNPRVKYRKKFEKAVVRRKGQVREPRKEIRKYGGEMTGINVRAVKSVKFK